MKVVKITQTRTSSVLYDTNGKIISRIRVKEKTVEYIPRPKKEVEPPIKAMIERFLKDQRRR